MPKAPSYPNKVRGGYLQRDDAPGSFLGVPITPTWYSYDHGPIHFLVYRCGSNFTCHEHFVCRLYADT